MTWLQNAVQRALDYSTWVRPISPVEVVSADSSGVQVRTEAGTHLKLPAISFDPPDLAEVVDRWWSENGRDRTLPSRWMDGLTNAIEAWIDEVESHLPTGPEGWRLG